MPLPPCGLYRTSEPIGSVPAGRLVYFHNHGDPGPGIYLPERWEHNRARFARRGVTLPDESLALTLEPLPAEGLYRVTADFTCCAKNCRTFGAELLVQLGYNGAGQAILFVPRFTPEGLLLPEQGTLLDGDRLGKLAALRVEEEGEPGRDERVERGLLLH
ncbi:MAG: hypothetical protein RBU45_12535 [Myxococcota bacterium]|jgi:hypothetical protein|nr:hypothetical protein [Myxococcota bacterium]